MNKHLLPGLMLLLTGLFPRTLKAQYDTINVPVNGAMVPCGPRGSEKDPTKPEYNMNPKKNRYDIPSASDFNNAITLAKLISPTAKKGVFTEGQAIIIEGYVDSVGKGGTETCNCDTEDSNYKDTHIQLVPTKGDMNTHHVLIVEVTPRMRMIEKGNGVNWSTRTLHKTLTGHHVRVTGWLMYDWGHVTQNWADAPKNKKDWRASCWEVHPITKIEILD